MPAGIIMQVCHIYKNIPEQNRFIFMGFVIFSYDNMSISYIVSVDMDNFFVLGLT